MNNSMNSINWKDLIRAEQNQPYFSHITEYLAKEKQQGKIIYPLESDRFNAFKYTDFNQVKVVILGQDPYHGENQAHGLAFSVRPHIKVPPSLKNIYKELSDDISGFQIPNHGYLVSWAKQGVLLLNTVLTVEQGKAHSHAKIGWETFTDHIIAAINHHKKNVVFLLWGNHAQQKGVSIDPNKHCILTSVHPSPLSAHRGFFGCKHFSLANDYLKKTNQIIIDWNHLKSEE